MEKKMKKTFKNIDELFGEIKMGQVQNRGILAEIQFENADELKASLFHLFEITKTKNENSACNILYHHINEAKVKNVREAGYEILEKGLKCNYSTIFRTLTYSCTDSNNVSRFEINKVYQYSYVTDRYNHRSTIISAIPKTIKSNGETINFSSPDMNKLQKDWSDTPYIAYARIKGERVDQRFILCMIDINEEEKTYNLVINPDSYLLMSSKNKEKTKSEFLTKLQAADLTQTATPNNEVSLSR